MQKIVYFSNKIISPSASPLPVRLGHGTESRKNTNCKAPATWKSRELAEGRQFRRLLHNYDVQFPDTTCYFEAEPYSTTMELPFSFWTCGWPLTIKLKETSSIIDKLRTQISRGRQDGCAQKILSYST